VLSGQPQNTGPLCNKDITEKMENGNPVVASSWIHRHLSRHIAYYFGLDRGVLLADSYPHLLTG
jgi:hypothetical protein